MARTCLQRLRSTATTICRLIWLYRSMLLDKIWQSSLLISRHFGFDPTGNGAVGSAVPENPTLEPNMKGIGWRVAELWQFELFAKCVNRPWGRSSVVNVHTSCVWSHTPLSRWYDDDDDNDDDDGIACPHCRRKARHFVAEKWDCRWSDTVAEKCDSRRISPLSRRFRRHSHFSATVWTWLIVARDE